MAGIITASKWSSGRLQNDGLVVAIVTSGGTRFLQEDGAWATPASGTTYSADETSVHLSGTTFSILTTWAGQAAITIVGTIATGVWHGTVIDSTYGGTGVNNAGRTLTIAASSGTISFTSTVTLTVAATASISGTNTGDQTSVTGNAGTATALQTARAINGVNFDGTAAITVPPGIGFIVLQEQQTSGTNGGTFTSGAKQTRVLNAKPTDTGSDCSLSSNLFTLSAGTYEIEASAPGYFCGSHKTFLQNTTAGTTLLTGTSEYSSNANTDGVVTRSLIAGRFTVAGGQALAIQHQCQATKATNGFGQACSFGTEIYTTVQLRRVA